MASSVYGDVTPGEVKLFVRANAQLAPPLVYMLVFTNVQYHVSVASYGSVSEVTMPSKQYNLELNCSDVAQFADNTNTTVTALNLGSAQVTLVDRNIEEEFRHPSSLVIVMKPPSVATRKRCSNRPVKSVSSRTSLSNP